MGLKKKREPEFCLQSIAPPARRLDNTRLKRELRVRLAHPTVHTGLREEI
jgi:hypothetical protein